MPSLKTIRKRITSVKSTQKITRALKMVAGARLNRAQQRIVALRPYAVKTADVLQSIAATTGTAGGEGAVESAIHPLLDRREEKKVLFLVMSSDRGLCGGFNTNITKATYREWKAKEAAGAEVVFATAGRKAREYIQRRGGNVVQDFPQIFDGLDIAKASAISDWLVPKFLKKEFDAVYLVYNEFKSAITQRVSLEPLLPLKPAEPKKADTGSANDYAPEFLYEPNQRALLERLVPMYVEITIYRGLLESQASFFGAQMTAMDAATRNAKEMIGKLTLVYNRARQAAITKELMEIIGGAEALKD